MLGTAETPRAWEVAGKPRPTTYVIRELSAQGKTDREIAEALGIEVKHARVRRIALGLPCNRIKTRPQQVAELVAQGKTVSQMMRALGMTQAAVYTALSRAKLKARLPRKKADTMRLRVWRLARAGKSGVEIQQAIGRDKGYVGAVIYQLRQAGRLGLTPEGRRAKRREQNHASIERMRNSALGDEIRRLHAMGRTDREIAEATGLGNETAKIYRLKLHLKPNRKLHPKHLRVLCLLSAGNSNEDVAERLGVTPNYVAVIKHNLRRKGLLACS